MSPAAFIEAARSWIGVPFHHQGRSRDGVDCVGLPICVLREAGELPPRFRDNTRYGRLPMRELDAALAAWCERAPVPVPGALLTIQWPRFVEPSHTAIFTGSTLIHAYRGIPGVIEHPYGEPWIRQTAAVWLLPGVRYE